MKKNGFIPIIIILVIAILGVVGYFGYKQFLPSSFFPIIDESEKPVSSKNIHEDVVNGFSFRVPDGFPVATDYILSNPSTVVRVYKTSDLPDEKVDPYTITKSISELMEKLLKASVPDKNEIQKLLVSWGLRESSNIINKGNHNIYNITTFAAYDLCGLSFHRDMVFAIKDGFVEITIMGDGEKYKTLLPEYIYQDDGPVGVDKYCFKYTGDGGDDIDGMSELYGDLVGNQSEIDKEVVEWFNAFDVVIDSLTFDN